MPNAPQCFAGAPARFDLLLVAPEAFRSVLPPYQRKKAERGVLSHALFLSPEGKTRAGALAEFPGVDDPERVKRAIEHAHAKHGAKYVLLAGDAALVPTRWRYVKEADDPSFGYWAGWHDGSYRPTDHYYACLYSREPGPRFDDWDADHDGKYDEQVWARHPLAITYNPDEVTAYPDVAVGRVPARTAEELAAYLDKVTRYEATPAAWPRQFAFVADATCSGSTEFSAKIQAALPERLVSTTIRCLLHAANTRSLGQWTGGTEASLAELAASAFWLSYVGNGGTDGWASPSGDKPAVACLGNGPNLPIVFAVASASGAFVANPPLTTYRDVDGLFRHYVYHPHEPSEEHRIEEVDPAGQHVRWVPRPLIGPPPAPYDLRIPATRGRCVASAWLCNDKGGAICYFGQTVECECDHGRDLEAALLAQLGNRHPRLGDAWLAAQRQFWADRKLDGSVFGAPRIYLSIMTMFGDPSLRLPGQNR